MNTVISLLMGFLLSGLISFLALRLRSLAVLETTQPVIEDRFSKRDLNTEMRGLCARQCAIYSVNTWLISGMG
jgi:hypothetical protein